MNGMIESKQSSPSVLDSYPALCRGYHLLLELNVDSDLRASITSNPRVAILAGILRDDTMIRYYSALVNSRGWKIINTKENWTRTKIQWVLEFDESLITEEKSL